MIQSADGEARWLAEPRDVSSRPPPHEAKLRAVPPTRLYTSHFSESAELLSVRDKCIF